MLPARCNESWCARDRLFREPRHAYTLGLLNSVPRADLVRQPLASIPGQPPLLNGDGKVCRIDVDGGAARATCRLARPPCQIGILILPATV